MRPVIGVAVDKMGNQASKMQENADLFCRDRFSRSPLSVMRIHEKQREHHFLRTTLSYLQNTYLPQYPTDAQSLGRVYEHPYLYLSLLLSRSLCHSL